MRKTIIPASILIVLSVLFFSFKASTKPSNTGISYAAPDSSMVTDESASAAALYSELNLSSLGLGQEAFDYAINGYLKLQAEGKVSNHYLTVIDMSQSGREKRFYLINMRERKLEMNTYVSHGKNSGLDMATRFSNTYNSEASSLGFYITKQTYTGKHGISLRLDGQEEGFNNNALGRGIVVHGAAYVNAARANSAYMGRSQGCPALPERDYSKAIQLIKNGSVMFIYHPTEEYLQKSELIEADTKPVADETLFSMSFLFPLTEETSWNADWASAI